MNGIKKISIRILLGIYALSYFLQNTFFVDRKKVYAGENPNIINLVAVFVDKTIYDEIKTNLTRYTSKYIQQKINNSKAIILPIDTKSLKAYEISAMLENMYFEGVKDQSSKLIGVILIGDIPLPVVQNNGFIYPSIFPYVDFEKQQFIYDKNKKFFVDNGNPNGQAEIRHGLIKFNKASEYNTFFNKIKQYYNNPNTFIDKAIWYDDIIGLKKYYIPENNKYYINNIMFSEDIGYHRFTNLLLNTLKEEHNKENINIGEELNSNIEDIEDKELKNYANMIKKRKDEAESIEKKSNANIPTMTLKKATQEMLKTYDQIISTTYQTKVRDNIAGIARRYKNIEGKYFDNINSHIDKIVQKDNWMLGDLDNNFEPLAIQINNYLESGLNDEIEKGKRYMKIPVPVGILNYEGEKKKLKCTRAVYDYYHNYYFGKNIDFLDSVEDTNIYKGTYQNLESLSGQTVTKQMQEQSIGGSYKIFSTQVEANKGYNINSSQEELNKYNQYKINKQELRGLHCPSYLFGREKLNICIRKREWKPNDSENKNKCILNDKNLQGGCESLTGFSQRMRGGASPMNIDANTQKLTNYDYRGAKLPIYDIAGSKKIDTPEPNANSFKGAMSYASLIQEKFGGGDLQSDNTIQTLINFPYNNGNNLIFTNQYPIGNKKDRKNPPIQRRYNPPKTYADANFFDIYQIMPSKTINAGKAVLYQNINGECGGKGSIYTYKTLDSRVKNISPKRNQISNTKTYKFKNESDLENFYTNVIKDLARIKNDIINKNNELKGTENLNNTGIIADLNWLKNTIKGYNNSMLQITTFPSPTLLGYNSTQITNLAQKRSEENLNPMKAIELKNKIQEINQKLDNLLNYMDTLSINHVWLRFLNIIQTENLKGQKVEILNSWKNNIITNLDYIITNLKEFKKTFENAKIIYDEINTSKLINYKIAIVTQKSIINKLHVNNNGGFDGCTTKYKEICDILDNIKTTLTNELDDINDQIEKMREYENGTNDLGIPIKIKPFEEIKNNFENPKITEEINEIKTIINTFDTTDDSNKEEINKGMNMTTPDRPIDNIRNITFQGVGGDEIKFIYPNIYEISIYKSEGEKLILKTIPEIRESLKEYLRKKVDEYNNLLNDQLNKKNNYYKKYSAQFNFIGQLDQRANPLQHQYPNNPIPRDYFIEKIIEFLEILEQKYGKTYMYGNKNIITQDQKLDIIAKILYYRNQSRPEKIQQTKVTEILEEHKNSFDINQKINDTIQTYLTENNDQGKFLTPTYNTTGYEIAYINSDGEDYLSSKSVPNFIKQIQSLQIKAIENDTTVSNAFIENTDFIEDTQQTNSLLKEIQACEGIDNQGSALIFDFKTASSPWIKAIKCWREKTKKQPINMKISFKHALGPVFVGNLKEIGNNLENINNERKEYGNQRNTLNNKENIEDISDDMQITINKVGILGANEIKAFLNKYETQGILEVTNTIQQIQEETNTGTITINTAENIGEIKIKIYATGDNCIGIYKNTKEISKNLCSKAEEIVINPNNNPITYQFTTTKKISGRTAIFANFCLPTTKNICITKSKIIEFLPGPVNNITIKTPTKPSILIGGGKLPLQIEAKDKYGNTIGQTIESYIIKASTGNLSNGVNENQSITINNFSQGLYIYTAPKTSKNISATINISDTNTQKERAKTNIIIDKGNLTIKQGNTIIYETNKQQSGSKIIYTLPKDEKEIQYKDDNDILQINPEKIPQISIKLVDSNGNKLDTIANITSKGGLLLPGITKTTTINKNNKSYQQKIFIKSSDFLIQDGKLDVMLYPSFKAGEDTIMINIPGIEPINLPINVFPGDAKKIILKMENNKMDTTKNTTIQGTIQVVDTWNNKIITPTKIKIGTLGPGTINTTEIIYTGNQYTYTITAKKPGGEGYVFAYLSERQLSDQIPGYSKFIVQENILPKEKLNIMYLNLFGTDRGNQRGFFSENSGIVNMITNQSNKLLATTTQLIDPTKIKQITYIINPNNQIQSIDDQIFSLTLQNKKIIGVLGDIAKVELGESKNFSIKTLTSTEKIPTIKENTIIYIPEPTDSIITGNQANTNKIIINNTVVLDINKGEISPDLTIIGQQKTYNDMTSYKMLYKEKTIGTLLIRSNEKNIIDIQDPTKYEKTNIFVQGSTNIQGIGIYKIQSTFNKNGYESIEDSNNTTLGIGFSHKFKNITNFANGKSVGEATIPYGSQFLINFGDPLLTRKDKNTTIPETDFDASFGQTIYTDPTKSILQVTPIDINNDGLKDLLVIYSDGTIKLIKNYGGTQNYKNLEELMIVAEPIKEIHIGDVDGNNYEDIIVITNNNKGLVYTNNKGIISVDGKNICINTSTEPGTITDNPDDFEDINQFIMEDMDKDGNIDIITNDNMDDIKIFYGGTTNQGANYISNTTGTCDNERYQRQKNNYQTIQRYGIQINENRYITDDSLIHRKDMETPQIGTNEEENTSTEENNTITMSEEQIKAMITNNIKDIAGNTNEYIRAGMNQLAYIQNPTNKIPKYETTNSENIYYLPIKENNDYVSVYKTYKDINGGILRNNDKVQITTTILSKKNNNKITYIDQIKGPREIQKNIENQITSFKFLTNNTGNLTIDRYAPEGYQFMIDNIELNTNEKIKFSYIATYKKQNPTIRIEVKDELLQEIRKKLDTFPDIIVQILDACQKNRRIFFNTKEYNKKGYEKVFDDIQKKLDEYYSGANANQQNTTNTMLDQISNITNLESAGELLGSENLENRTPKDLIGNIVSPGGGSLNINMNFIDAITKNVSKKIDQGLQGLCQGFKLGKDSCQGLPVPFNQAFLAPGKYHIFGCVPTPPNPLYPVFQTLNKTIGRGVPSLFIPGYIPTGTPPFTPFIGSAFVPATFKGLGDNFLSINPVNSNMPGSQFRLYIAPTLTLGVGIAMCFGSYSVGTKLPKPFSSMGGNCVVFAIPPKTNCGNGSNEGGNDNGPEVENLDASFVDAANAGVCNNPPKITNTLIFEENTLSEKLTVNSPFQMVSAANSSENNPHYSAAIPQGNFGGLIQIDQNPINTTISYQEESINTEGFELKKGPTINLKILGAKTKGLVKCLIQDWMTRQIQYIINNLTKMTIQIDFPDPTNLIQGFNTISTKNLKTIYKEYNKQDIQEGYITTGTKELSKKQLANLSEQIGKNPFDAILELFKDIPLINIDTKNINIKIPTLTTDDMNKYINYSKIRIEKNTAIIQQREEFIVATTRICKTIDNDIKNSENINQQIKDIETTKNKRKLTLQEKEELEELKTKQHQIQICLKITNKDILNTLISFRENSAGLIRSIKQNIKVMEQYKEFPTQLYQRTHLTDRYLTEIAGLVGDFGNNIFHRLDINAKRFSQYVDALILIIGAIKTWQVLIDFSVNRSEKCSKCSNDNYGAFSCSLSFLCPKLPILPIPPFKIPNIYMDLSHIELGINIILPKINFIPVKIPLPQLPNLPEPPSLEINRDILYGLDINLFKNMSLPSIPIIPEPPKIPEPPSFIPSIKMELPVLPPAPKIPPIIPKIEGILKTAEFIGKVFCIVKGSIGLVGESEVKAKIEQITQRTWNVPIFDFFDMTTTYKNPPLQGFDYKIDAYTTLKFNFDGVYDVFNMIAQSINNTTSKPIESTIQKSVNDFTEKINNNTLIDDLEKIEDFDQNIYLNGYHNTQEKKILEYNVAYNQLKKGLQAFKNNSATDKNIHNQINILLTTIENKSNITPAYKQIQEVQDTAKKIINKSNEENKAIQEQIKNYDTFIQKLQKTNTTTLVAKEKTSISLKTSLLAIDNTTKNILANQEDPTKSYLSLNKKMVEGYLNAINNESPKKLNMSEKIYEKSKKYLEETQQKIDEHLLAYTAPKQTLAQTNQSCPTCSNTTQTNYSTDISAYVNGIFIETYSGYKKNMINTVVSTPHRENIQNNYTIIDLNNDNKKDILMYDDRNIYIKYALQNEEHLSKGGNNMTIHSSKIYNYEIENSRNRWIKSKEHLQEICDEYGYLKLNDIKIKLIDTNQEVKNFITEGQSIDSLQISRKNNTYLGEDVDGYIIKVYNKIDAKDTPKNFWNIFGNTDRPKYILVLPEGTDYTTGLLTIDENTVKKPIKTLLGKNIFTIINFNPNQEKINITINEAPREWLYMSIATLTAKKNTQNKFTLYKKSSPWSNQTVAGKQTIGDNNPPTGEITLYRNSTHETISTGNAHQGFINTTYTLKTTRTDDVIVKKMIINRGNITKEITNTTQTGYIEIPGLLFTGITQETFEAIAIDQNNNIAKETITLDINIPEIQIIDVKKTGEETAAIIAQLSNDIDTGNILFQRLRNNKRTTISGTNQNLYGGFNLIPKQTIITGGIFTLGNTIGLFDKLGNELATIDPKTGEIKIHEIYKNMIKIVISFSSHIPIVEIREKTNEKILFQIALPIKNIEAIETNPQNIDYKKIELNDEQFGPFAQGNCIQNKNNECIIYTNNQGAIYIPGIYANILKGEYKFEKTTKNTIFLIKDQSNKEIATIKFTTKSTTK